MSAALGDTAVQLPWLAPGVAALVAMTRPHRPDFWSTIRPEPGAVLLLLRHLPHDQPPEPFRPARLTLPAVRLAQRLLAEPQAGVFDSNHPAVRNVLAASRTCARFAETLAEKSGRCDPDCAAAAGLLAPLGWLAAVAVRPDAVAACLGDPDHAGRPDATQQRHWSTTAVEVARRLARRWELPAWLAAIVGYLDLPANLAPTFGADPTLFTVVQAAVALAARSNDRLRMAVGTPVDEALGRLGLGGETVADLAEPPDPRPDNPYDSPLLPTLLELAADDAGRKELALVPRLESEVDDLHRLLMEQRAGEGERLRAQKLAALAEFAAGAGHEINNPLAVISGQAQYLLGPEPDAERQKSLRTIVQQSQRIHLVLTDLMQFARPGKPQKRHVEARDLAREAAGVVAELAGHRRVRVEVMTPDEPCVTDVDPKQMGTALACLLRNAIEAAGPVAEADAPGWARIRVEVTATDRLRIAVEDSGPGPTAAQAEHMFDPFYSGRPAGRGKGLGLPTAWRLAREQGGDVAYEPQPNGPTRFVLSLARVPILPVVEPRAA